MKVEIELSEKDLEDMLTQYLSARNIVAKNSKDIAKKLAKGLKDTKIVADAPQRLTYPNHYWTYPNYPFTLTGDSTVFGNGGIGIGSQPLGTEITYQNGETSAGDPNFGRTVTTSGFVGSVGVAGSVGDAGPVVGSSDVGYDSEGTYTRAANE